MVILNHGRSYGKLLTRESHRTGKPNWKQKRKRRSKRQE